MKWVYLTTAPDQWTAEIWRGFLSEEGIPVMLQAGDVTSFLGNSPFPCRLLVVEERKDEALDLLKDQLESGPLDPPPV